MVTSILRYHTTSMRENGDPAMKTPFVTLGQLQEIVRR